MPDVDIVSISPTILGGGFEKIGVRLLATLKRVVPSDFTRRMMDRLGPEVAFR